MKTCKAEKGKALRRVAVFGWVKHMKTKITNLKEFEAEVEWILGLHKLQFVPVFMRSTVEDICKAAFEYATNYHDAIIQEFVENVKRERAKREAGTKGKR